MKKNRIYLQKNRIFLVAIALSLSVIFSIFACGCDQTEVDTSKIHIAASNEYVLQSKELSSGDKTEDYFCNASYVSVTLYFTVNANLYQIGSGIIASYDGYVVTLASYFVAWDSDSRVYARLNGDEENKALYPLKVVAFHDEYNLMLLQFEKTVYHLDANGVLTCGFEHIATFYCETPTVGALCHAVGVLDFDYSSVIEIPLGITEGTVCLVEDEKFYTTAPISFGNGGGLVMDENGYTVGMVLTNGASRQNPSSVLTADVIVAFLQSNGIPVKTAN